MKLTDLICGTNAQGIDTTAASQPAPAGFDRFRFGHGPRALGCFPRGMPGWLAKMFGKPRDGDNAASPNEARIHHAVSDERRDQSLPPLPLGETEFTPPTHQSGSVDRQIGAAKEAASSGAVTPHEVEDEKKNPPEREQSQRESEARIDHVVSDGERRDDSLAALPQEEVTSPTQSHDSNDGDSVIDVERVTQGKPDGTERGQGSGSGPVGRLAQKYIDGQNSIAAAGNEALRDTYQGVDRLVTTHREALQPGNESLDRSGEHMQAVIKNAQDMRADLRKLRAERAELNARLEAYIARLPPRPPGPPQRSESAPGGGDKMLPQ